MLFFPGSDPDPWKRNGAQIQFIFTQWFINALQYPQAFQTFFLIFLLNYLSKHNISEAETRLWSNLQAEKQAWCPFRSRFRPKQHFAPRNQGTGTLTILGNHSSSYEKTGMDCLDIISRQVICLWLPFEVLS